MADEVARAVLYELGMAELLLVVVLILALPVAGLWVVGDDAPVFIWGAVALVGLSSVRSLLHLLLAPSLPSSCASASTLT